MIFVQGLQKDLPYEIAGSKQKPFRNQFYSLIMPAKEIILSPANGTPALMPL
jgi:hypothetical protein